MWLADLLGGSVWRCVVPRASARRIDAMGRVGQISPVLSSGWRARRAYFGPPVRRNEPARTEAFPKAIERGRGPANAPYERGARAGVALPARVGRAFRRREGARARPIEAGAEGARRARRVRVTHTEERAALDGLGDPRRARRGDAARARRRRVGQARFAGVRIVRHAREGAGGARGRGG